MNTLNNQIVEIKGSESFRKYHIVEEIRMIRGGHRLSPWTVRVKSPAIERSRSESK